MSNAVGSKCAVRGIHSSAYTAWELYASMIIFMAIQVRLCFKSAPMENDTLEHMAKHKDSLQQDTKTQGGSRHIAPVFSVGLMPIYP
jgi:hypothetical protein